MIFSKKREVYIKKREVYIMNISDGYSWRELYFDEINNEFFCKDYHTGSVDDAAEYYDGTSIISWEDAVMAIKEHIEWLYKFDSSQSAKQFRNKIKRITKCDI